MAKKPRGSERKNEFIMSHHILIAIYKGEYKVRREVDRDVL